MKNDATIRLCDIDICKYLVKIFTALSRRLQSLPFNFYLPCAFFLLVGCSTTQPPVLVVDSVKSGSSGPTKPIESSNQGNQFYIVQKGDTLYGIALSHGIDFKKLAEWNDIADPKTIRPGQRISLSIPTKDSQPELFALPQQSIETTIDPGIHPLDPKNAIAPENNNIVNSGKVKTNPKALKLPFSEQNVARLQYPTKNSLPAAQSSPIPSTTADKNTKIEVAPQPDPSKPGKASDHSNAEWIWPTTGKLLSSFSKNSKGVKISGQAGQPVLASAAGEVVYSGHGLRGYGNLIIIKHDNTFLSAYAHNSKLLVKEGEAVIKGQKIAEMGNTDTDTIQLHFEIRKHGKPVDPLEYLPHQS